MGRKGETVSYTTPSFEEEYTSRLNEIKVALKSILYGDNPFVVGAEYACKVCSGRVHIHTQTGKWLCLLCALKPGGQAPRWAKETRTKVEEIMAGYPDPQQCYTEWSAQQPKRQAAIPQEARMPKLPADRKEVDPERREFGRRLREARKARGLSIDQLAVQIIKEKKRESLTSSAIQMYESGAVYPPEYILKQLVEILGSQILEEKKVEAVAK